MPERVSEDEAPWRVAEDRGMGRSAPWQRAQRGGQYAPPGFDATQDGGMRGQGGWDRSQPAWMEPSASAIRRAPLPPRPPTPSQAMRAALRHWMALAVADLAFTIGFGILGGVMGGCFWFFIATHFHFELGLFGLPMAYLIGKGIAVGSGQRGFLSYSLAFLLTLFGWVIVLSALQGQGFTLNVLDGVAWFIGCICALYPVLQLPKKND